jgi:hypothetical protein
VESTYFLYKATRDPHYLQATFFNILYRNGDGLLLLAGLRRDIVMQTFFSSLQKKVVGTFYFGNNFTDSADCQGVVIDLLQNTMKN